MGGIALWARAAGAGWKKGEKIMALKSGEHAVAASREMWMSRFYWHVSMAIAVAAMLLAAGYARAQADWVRPAPPLVGYVGSSETPQLCQRTYPLVEGCWLGLDPQQAIDKVCALHGDVRGSTTALPGNKLFAAQVQCATKSVGIAGQPFYCDSSGLVEAKYTDKNGKTAFSCTPPPGVVSQNKSMGRVATAAEGVNVAAGNAYLEETDFRNGANPLLEIRRTYNSLDARPRAFGFNWVGSYERRLEVLDGLRVVAWRPDANMYYFDQAGKRFVAEAGVKDKLVKVAAGKSGVAWRYTVAASRVVEEYDARGVLIGLRHPGGAAVDMEYSSQASAQAPGAGYLLRVADDAGRWVSFSYDAQGRIVQATEGGGRRHTYVYGGVSGCRAQSGEACAAGNLTSVTAQGGVLHTYYYDEAAQAPISQPRALTGVSRNGIRVASWAYDLNGKAVSASIAGGAGKVARDAGTGRGSDDVVFAGFAKAEPAAVK
jgi:hypothetical protein